MCTFVWVIHEPHGGEDPAGQIYAVNPDVRLLYYSERGTYMMYIMKWGDALSVCDRRALI